MNPYEILGVEVDATKKQVRSSYKKLAQKYHPDKDEGCSDKFMLVQKAYDILIDKEKRMAYDCLGIHSDISSLIDEKIKKIMLEAIREKAENIVSYCGLKLKRMKSLMKQRAKDIKHEIAMGEGNLGRLSSTSFRNNLYDEIIKEEIECLTDELEAIKKEISLIEIVSLRLSEYNDERPEFNKNQFSRFTANY